MTSLQDVLSEMQIYHSEGIPVQPEVLGPWVDVLQRITPQLSATPKRGPYAPKASPMMTVSQTMLHFSRALTAQMAPCRRITVQVVDGKPVITPDAQGNAVCKPSRRGYTAWLTTPAVMEVARHELGVGTAWRMEWEPEQHCWRGSKIE